MLCITTADLPRGSPWHSPLYRGRISELFPLGVTLPQLPAAWLNLFWFSVALKKVIQEMDWTWSPVTCMEGEMDGKESSWLYLVSYTRILSLSYRILSFSSRNCIISSTCKFISLTFLYLIFYYLIAHDELHELSKTQSAIKARPLFKFSPYFSLAYTTAVNQACLFQTSFIPLVTVRQVWQVSKSRVSFCKFCGSQCQD